MLLSFQQWKLISLNASIRLHGTYNPEDERFSDARPGLMEIAVGLKNDDPYLINENIDLSSCLICGGK